MTTPDKKKRNSCKAVIIDNEQLLCVKKQDEIGPYYVIPGGGQDWGEELSETLIRECIEEIGAKPIEIDDLLCIREYLGFKQDFPNANKNLHQIEFYWHCKVKREDVKIGGNPDSKQIGIEWLEIKDLEKLRIYPKIIIEKVKMLNDKIKDGISANSSNNIYVGAAD